MLSCSCALGEAQPANTVVRSRPFGGWLFYARVWCSPLWCGPIPPLWWLAVLRKGLVLAVVDVAVSVRRCDAWLPLLPAQRLLKALGFRLLFFLSDGKLCASGGGGFAGGPILPLGWPFYARVWCSV